MSPDEACDYPIDLENHFGYVYCITFPNGKQYIGQSRRPWRERWKNHQKKSSGCIALHNALNKYASMPLTWELLAYARNARELTKKEAYYILSKDTLTPNGYNIVIPTNDSKNYKGYTRTQLHDIYSNRKLTVLVLAKGTKKLIVALKFGIPQ